MLNPLERSAKYCTNSQTKITIEIELQFQVYFQVLSKSQYHNTESQLLYVKDDDLNKNETDFEDKE